MNFKKLFCILLALCFVPCIAAASSTQNLLSNPGFETPTESLAESWQKNYPAHLSLNTDAKYVRNGTNSLKLTTTTNNYPYATQRVSGLIPGAEYTYTAYVKTLAAGTSAAFAIEWYDTSGKMVLQSGSASYKEFSGETWAEITGTAVAPENVSYILLRLRMYGVGTVYWDDISFYKSKDPVKMRSLVTDDVFYYSDRVENGEVTVALNIDFHGDLIGQTAQLTFSCGEEILKTESLLIEGNRLRFSFPMAWIAAEKTKYTFTCTLEDEVLSQNVYRYPRPKFIREDGVYEENGEEFHPVYMYAAPSTNVLQELKDAGINLVQGYADKNWMEKCAALDMKQIVVLYAGATSAGNSSRLATTEGYVRAYKDDAAVFGWAVQDEPGTAASTLAELEAAYVAIRNIDDNHPVWITCNGHIDTLRKYADVLSYDAYPYNNNAFSYQTAAGIADSVEKAKGKPVYSLLQAFEAKDSFPTPSQLGSMIYQSFWGGAKGIGFYCYSGSKPGTSLPQTELWETILKFEKESRDAFSVFVKNKEAPITKGESDTSYWYVKKMDSTFWVMTINKSSTVSTTLEIPVDGMPQYYEVMLPDGSAETQIYAEGNTLYIPLAAGGYTFAKLRSAETGFVNSRGKIVTRGSIGDKVFPLWDANAAFSVWTVFQIYGDTEELTGFYTGENEASLAEGFCLEENTVYKLYSWDKNMKPIDKTKYIVADKEENHD